MKFLYDKNAGEERLKIVNEAFLHLKARRVEAGERISVRNLQDGKEYIYEIDEIERRSANLGLVFASLTASINLTLPSLGRLSIQRRSKRRCHF